MTLESKLRALVAKWPHVRYRNQLGETTVCILEECRRCQLEALLAERREPRDFERPEGLYLKLCEPPEEPNTPVIIERVNGDCSVSRFIIARDEAYNLIKQMKEFLEDHSHRNHAAQPSSGTGERK